MVRRIGLVLLFACWGLWVGVGFAADAPEKGAPGKASPPSTASGNAPSAASDQKVPVIAIPVVEHNFGTAPEGDTISHDFKVYNKGETTLEISNVRAG